MIASVNLVQAGAEPVSTIQITALIAYLASTTPHLTTHVSPNVIQATSLIFNRYVYHAMPIVQCVPLRMDGVMNASMV